MSTTYVSPNFHVPVPLAPGDEVIRYVNGEAIICTVIEVRADEEVRVQCQCWPSGYSAVVKAHEVVLLARQGQGMEMF